MEYILILIIIIVVLLLLGVSALTIVAGVWIFLAFIDALCVLFFLVMAIVVAGTKKEKAEYVKLEKGEKAGAFAIYRINGEEYRNTFPTDFFLEPVLYRKKEVTVRVRKFKDRLLVFDGVTLAVIAMGLPAFSVLLLVMI